MEDKLTDNERALFDSLSKEKLPPIALEHKVVEGLRRKNLINQKDMKTSKRKYWVIGIAASLLFFITGYIIGNSTSADSKEISSGYILLLHEDENFQPTGTEIEVFTQYAAWMGKMILNGVRITGNELSPESTAWVSGENNTLAISDDGDKISGYFIIDVQDIKEAQKIALSSPHIKFGGTVELIKFSDRN